MPSIDRLTRWALCDHIAEHGMPKVGDIIVLDLGFGAASADYEVVNTTNESCFSYMPNLSVKNTESPSIMPSFVSIHSDLTHPNNRRPPVEDRRL